LLAPMLKPIACSFFPAESGKLADKNSMPYRIHPAFKATATIQNQFQ
jgi:hypothetical protein